jgi:hypothetical protein
MARDIKIGDKEIRVRATPLALLFYKQEFKSDFMGDMVKLEKMKDSMANIDTTLFIQMIWAMCFLVSVLKAEQAKRTFLIQ